MKHIKKQFLFALALCMAVLLNSCIKEDMYACRAITVRLYHDQPAQHAEDRMSNHASLYVFDENGLFVKVFENASADFTDNSYTFSTDLDLGTYRFVAFRGLTGCYASQPHTFTPGITTFEQAIYQLNYTGGAVTELPTELYNGAIQNAVIASRNEHFDIRLTPQTYYITVRTEGLAPDNNDYDLLIRDNNSHFHFDNSFASCPQFDYTAPCDKNTATGQPFAALATMNMSQSRHPQIIFSNTTTQTTLFQADLMDVILRLLSARTPTVAFADAGRRFDIVLHFNQNMDVSISVNDWGTISDDIDL